MPVPDEEVVFLVLHYLRNLDGGDNVANATKQLEDSLVQSRLLPSVCDYTGASRVLTYEQCARKYAHIPPQYLPDALAERIPSSPVPINTLLANGLLNTVPSRSTTILKRKERALPNDKPSNYSVAAYRKKHSHSLTNIHALLDQVHTLDRPLPLRNILYSVLPKHLKRLKRVVGHHQPVYCAIYDFSGEYIVTGSDDHQLKVWSSRTGYLCHTLRGHEREINDITADPSRRTLVSASRDSSIRVWDLVTGENTYVLHNGTKGVNCVLFSPCPDRPYLLSGGDDGMARLWNTRNFEQVCLAIPLPKPGPGRRGQTVGTSGSASVSGAVRSRTGSTVGDSFPSQSPPIISAGESIPASSPPRTPSRMSSPPPAPAPSAPRHNEANSGPARITPLPHQGVNFGGVLMEANGGVNSATGAGGFNVQSGRPLAQGTSQPRGAAGPSHHVAPSSSNVDPRTMAGPVAGAHVGAAPPPNALPLPPPGPPAPAHSAQNNSIVSSSPSAQVLSVAFNTGATRLAIAGSDCMTHVYSITKEAIHGSLPTVRLLTTLRGHSSKITQVVFSHHGDRLCTASADGTSRVYRRVNARLPSKVRGPQAVPGLGTWKCVVLDCRRQNTEVPSISQAGGSIVNSITPRVPRSGRYPSHVDAVMWSLHDDYVITASSDGKVRVWNADTGQLVHILDAHTREVYIMDTHPFDKRVIFTAGYDGKCIIWDIETGKELRRVSTDNGIDNSHQNALHPAVMDGHFSPDGLSFCVTDTSGALTMFGLGAGDCMLLAPEEQFFSNDIIPFRRDAQQRAISQETAQLLHLLPKGDLCDSQLRRHSPEVQLHSRDFYKNLPGAKERATYLGGSKTEADIKNARGEEFRRNEEREERQLVRTALEEKRRAMRAREKARLEKDDLIIPVRNMKDFVVSDSDKDSDGDYKLDPTESEPPSSDEENDAGASSDSSEEVIPRRRRRKVRMARKRTRTSNATNDQCTCDNMGQMQDSDYGSDGSDESFRPEDSDAFDSDPSGDEPMRQSVKSRKSIITRAPALEESHVDPLLRTSTSSLPRMTIHLSRSQVATDPRRSPGRSLTSERRPDLDQEDTITPQQPPPFSRASSSNAPRPPDPPLTSQWSAQSAATSQQTKRRSPRNKSKIDDDDDDDEPRVDVDEISRQEILDLAKEDMMHVSKGPRRKGRRGRKKKKRIRTATTCANDDTDACPVHTPQDAQEDEDSDASVRIRRKRRKVVARSVMGLSQPKKEHAIKKHAWDLASSEWLRGTMEKYNYIPQRGDDVMYFPTGHAEAMARCKGAGVDPLRTAAESSGNVHRLNGIELEGRVTTPVRFTIVAITYDFPKMLRGNNAPAKVPSKATHRAVAILTLARNDKLNLPLPHEVTLAYFSLDDVPEYLVLSSRVEAAIANNWKKGDRFRMLFINERQVWSYYSGVVQSVAQGLPYMGWNAVEVLYDTDDDPDKGTTDLVSPWELECLGAPKPTKSKSVSTRKHSGYLEIANEIHHLQASDQHFGNSVTWLDTVHNLAANPEYCRTVPLPMDLHIILTRLCTAFYRSYDAFTDDVNLIKRNAQRFNGQKSDNAQMVAKLCDTILHAAQRTRNIVAQPPVAPGASASSRRLQMNTLDPVASITNLHPPRLPGMGYFINGASSVHTSARLVAPTTPRLPPSGIFGATSASTPVLGYATPAPSNNTPLHSLPYQENSRNEHSSISIAAASTMSCAGENKNPPGCPGAGAGASS